MFCFNSTLVRLKGSHQLYLLKGHAISFNSTLVRLKAETPEVTQVPEEMFQFHTGSIKSEFDNEFDAMNFEFQFHTGSIKSDFDYDNIDDYDKFQFHTGSIKSAR